MREQSPPSPLHISGDTLALDRALRARLQAEASSLQDRYPDTPIRLSVKIAEEFDQRHGHRVRCELVATTDARQQVVVREAQKDPLAAIAGAFASAKRQLRRLSLRGSRLAIAATPQLQPSGA